MANSRSFPYLPFGNRERTKAEKTSESPRRKGEPQQGISDKKTSVDTSEVAFSGIDESRPSNTAQDNQQPFITVLQGNPTDEEIAALTAVVSAMAAQNTHDEYSTLALWQRQLNRGQRLGDLLRPGPGSWRRARPM